MPYSNDLQPRRPLEVSKIPRHRKVVGGNSDSNVPFAPTNAKSQMKSNNNQSEEAALDSAILKSQIEDYLKKSRFRDNIRLRIPRDLNSLDEVKLRARISPMRGNSFVAFDSDSYGKVLTNSLSDDDNDSISSAVKRLLPKLGDFNVRKETIQPNSYADNSVKVAKQRSPAMPSANTINFQAEPPAGRANLAPPLSPIKQTASSEAAAATLFTRPLKLSHL